jgi:hypothetical protein
MESTEESTTTSPEQLAPSTRVEPKTMYLAPLDPLQKKEEALATDGETANTARTSRGRSLSQGMR